MISKHYSIFCDECTHTEALYSGSVKDCTNEAMNLGWTIAKDKHTYCPACSLKKVQEANNTQE